MAIERKKTPLFQEKRRRRCMSKNRPWRFFWTRVHSKSYGEWPPRVLSSRTDFFVDMSGQISSRRRQFSTKQWSGNNCSDISTKIQIRVTWWIIGTGQVNSGGLSVKHAAALAWQRAFRKQSSLFEGLFYLYFVLNVSFHFQNSTLLCRQNRIFVDMSYFLKIAVLSPILSTKCLSTTALKIRGPYSLSFSTS